MRQAEAQQAAQAAQHAAHLAAQKALEQRVARARLESPTRPPSAEQQPPYSPDSVPYAPRALPDRTPPQAPYSEAQPAQPEMGEEPDTFNFQAPPRPSRRVDYSAPDAFGDADFGADFGDAPQPPAAPQQGRQGADQQGAWTWRDLLSGADNDGSGGQAAPGRQSSPKRRSQRATDNKIPNAQPWRGGGREAPGFGAEEAGAGDAMGIVGVVERSGLRLSEVFSASGLDRIAQRARGGSHARRRAVQDAAPDAVRRLADYLSRDAAASQEAMRFLRADGARIAELLGRGRAQMDSEITRAFLLIDAAA